MRLDGRLSRMLHVLVHLDQHEGPLTSETIAAMIDTNPTVVRRTMAGLREAGHARSEKGHGGGWTLARPLDEISLLDVYRAIGEPELFALGLSSDHPSCCIEQAVNDALGRTLDEAEQRLRQRFAEITLADIRGDCEARLAALRTAAARS